jgi:KDO2-lipid IV(A) lauroyltransferase
MANTLRRIMQISKEKKKYLIGFIADQVPTWESINHWLDFFHRDTPVFTGTEKIAQRTGASLFYGRMERVKRGKYVMHLELMAENAAELKEFEATNMYYERLTENIRQSPELWLWTHKRWKRTREGYARREQKRVEDKRRLVEREMQKRAAADEIS